MYLFLGMIVLVGAGMAYLMIAPPTDLIRTQMISQVKEKTGRDLKIAGKPQITFYPALGLSMSNVSLSAPPGMNAPDMLTAKSLTVAVKLLPLLGQNIEVDRLILDSPVIDLRADKQGRKSWDFAVRSGFEELRPVRYAQAGGATNDGAGLPPEAREFLQNASPRSGVGGGAAALDGLKLGDVRIVNGTIRYADEATGASETVRKLNVNLALEDVAAPLSANGDAVYKGEKVAFEATLRSLKQVLNQQSAKLVLTVAGNHVAAGFDGNLTVADVVKADGALSADSGSVRKLAKWLGSDLPPAPGFGPLSLKGRLSADGPVYRLSRLTATLDGAKATGEVAARTDGARPLITADLQLSELNLNNYMAPGEGAAAPGGDAGGVTRVKGTASRDGWNTDPIDLSGLNAVDAKVRLAVGRLMFKDMKAEQALIDAKLNGGALRADLSDMKLYQGTGRGVVTATSKGVANSEIGANFTFDNIAALPLLKDAAKIDRIDGKGRLQLALGTQGGSEAAFVSALNGTMNFTFNDGAIVGVNVPKYIRAISGGQIANLNQASTEKTDFSEMSATFKITNGIARNDDLTLLSPLLRVGGSGQVALPTRQIDYTVRPKLVNSLSGQGGETAASGLEIPVRITGSFDNPQYRPDLAGVLKDPSQAIDAVKGVAERFKGKKAGEILDGILGGGGDSGGSGSNGQKIDGKELLRGLFGR